MSLDKKQFTGVNLVSVNFLMGITIKGVDGKSNIWCALKVTMFLSLKDKLAKYLIERK